MADQTVKLKLTGDASDLRKDLDQTGRSMDELGASGTEAGQDIERAVTGSEKKVRSLKDTIGEAGVELGSLGGAVAGIGISNSLDDAVVSSGKLQAQLGLSAEEAEQFDDISKRVYGDNFGDTMGEAAQVVGQVQQSLGLTGDELKATTEGVFSISDAFGHLGADTNIILEDVRALTRNFPGLTESRALDLIAAGFQSGAGSAGDLQDVLQEYPQDFARLGLSADDMLGILDAGMESGVRNADIMADSVRELGIRISTAGDTGQEALREMFPPAEARRLIDDLTAGGEAGRDAFFTILDGLTAVQDPQDRYNLAIQLMGTRGEEVANALPGMRDALAEVRDGTFEAEGATESLNAQYTGMRNMLEGIGRTIETSFLGPVLDAGGGAAEAATGIGTLALGAQGLGINFGTVKDRARSMVGSLRSVEGATRALGFAGAAAGALLLADMLGNARREAALFAEEVAGGFSDPERQLSNVRAEIEVLQDIAGKGVRLDLGDSIALFSSDEAKTAQNQLDALEDKAAQLELQISLNRDAASELGDTYVDVSHALDSGLNPAEAHHAIKMQESAAAAGESEDAVAGAGDAYDDTADQTLTAAEAIDEYIAANRRATDPVFRLMDAISKVDDAQQAYNDAVDKYGAESSEASNAAINLMQRVQDLEAAAIDGELSFAEFEGQLNRWVEDGRITAEQAAAIRDRVAEARGEADQFEGTRNMVLNASGNAWDRIARINRQVAALPRNVQIRAEGGMEFRAEGGPVAPGQPYVVGEEGPELVTFGQRGMVHDTDTTRQMLGPTPDVDTRLLEQLISRLDSGRTLTVQQTFAGDVGRTTLAEARHQQRLAFLEAV